MGLEKFLTKIVEDKVAISAKGATVEDIAHLEEIHSILLPESYKKLMLTIGDDCGRLVDHNEYDFYVRDLNKINTFVKERRKLLKAYGEVLVELPERVFYILGRYNESFYYIIADGANDSSVWHYNMEDGKVEKRYDSVMEWANGLLSDAKVAVDLGHR